MFDSGWWLRTYFQRTPLTSSRPKIFDPRVQARSSRRQPTSFSTQSPLHFWTQLDCLSSQQVGLPRWCRDGVENPHLPLNFIASSYLIIAVMVGEGMSCGLVEGRDVVADLSGRGWWASCSAHAHVCLWRIMRRGSPVSNNVLEPIYLTLSDVFLAPLLPCTHRLAQLQRGCTTSWWSRRRDDEATWCPTSTMIMRPWFKDLPMAWSALLVNGKLPNLAQAGFRNCVLPQDFSEECCTSGMIRDSCPFDPLILAVSRNIGVSMDSASIAFGQTL